MSTQSLSHVRLFVSLWTVAWAPLVVLVIRTCLPVQETQEGLVPSLGQEDPWEKEMTTHSSILAWRMPWTEEPGQLQSISAQRIRYAEDTYNVYEVVYHGFNFFCLNINDVEHVFISYLSMFSG